MKTILTVSTGSRAYGTDIETSDYDFKGVYVQSNEDILGFKYRPQIEHNKDNTEYEVKRFLELCATGNPTLLEMLFTEPAYRILYTEAFDPIYSVRHLFLTKKCANSFGGFAVQQIQKARGLDKKMNWEKTKTERKTVLDFCFVHLDGKSLPVTAWLKREGKDQKYCGLVGLDRMPGCYSVYYDHGAQWGHGLRNNQNMGFHGIADDDSNDVKLSSVPKWAPEPLAVLYFNKTAYSQHCKDYKEYRDWLSNRNTQRYVDVGNHGQKIDGKNLLHCRRLIDCGLEIAQEGTLTVRRKNADFLLKIRRGEVPLEEIIEKAEEDIKELDKAFAASGLPEDVSPDLLQDIIIKVRKINQKP